MALRRRGRTVPYPSRWYPKRNQTVLADLVSRAVGTVGHDHADLLVQRMGRLVEIAVRDVAEREGVTGFLDFRIVGDEGEESGFAGPVDGRLRMASLKQAANRP